MHFFFATTLKYYILFIWITFGGIFPKFLVNVWPWKHRYLFKKSSQTMSKYRVNISMISGRFDMFVYNIKIRCVQMSSAH